MHSIPPVTVTITTLAATFLSAVDDLGRPSRGTIGFLPTEAILKILNKGWVYGAISDQGELVGYLIYARYSDVIRITQLCIADHHRGKGIARKLFDALKSSATTQKLIKLRCRRDFPAHKMWPRLGFIPLDERPGRSAAGHPLTLWCYRVAPDDELGLWRADASEDVLDVIIDAQIFFDFDLADAPNTLISKGLLNDALVDSLNLWITDELFHEIDRNSKANERKRSLDRARAFHCIEHSKELFERHRTALQFILPYNSPSEKSDLHHLAKTAASTVKVFVSKDQGILDRSNEIRDLCGIQVFHPVELITSIHDEANRQSLSPSRISGLQLLWNIVRKNDLEQLCAQNFQGLLTTKAKRRESLLSYLANPNNYQVQYLSSNQAPAAYRVLDRSKEGVLSIPATDVVRSPESEVFSGFIVTDALALAAMEGRPIVDFRRNGIPNHLEPLLSSMGFIKTTGSYQRVVLPKAITARPAIYDFPNLSTEAAETLNGMSSMDFERSCAPLVLNADLPCFLIPIKPSFAMGLLDQHESSSDLFGGDPTVLLRWENVYYRSKTRHHMLKSPARILWYVSGSIKRIVAISHLDEVECGMPKDLFRKHRRFGILEWRDVYQLCRKDIQREIMALKFSLTFALRHRISLAQLRSILEEQQIPLSLQAPSLLPHSVLLKIIEQGYRRS